ncbi:MAG: hypothetical protein U9R74_13320 [Pseudomonadota bacterium]|nr:hypothetical protein [Pseudomonadota bacterium]
MGPGQFEVDEEAADRALERTLIQTGVLLLQVGQVEIEPGFTYARTENDVPTVVTEGGQLFVGTESVRRNTFVADVAFRVGLPFESQFEVSVPYRWVDESTVTIVGFSEIDETTESDSAIGDVRVGLAKTFLHEGSWWPDLVGRLIWDSDTGDTVGEDVLFGRGFNEISGVLSAVKRQDPLAFVGAIAYTSAFEKDDIKPGDSIDFSLGALLAASPQTSLSFNFRQSFINELEFDGSAIGGSDQVVALASIGASSIVGKNKLLRITGDIGLTDAAPDYAIGLSLGWRFTAF